MATINEAYKSIADVNLWLKTQSGDDLKLSDIPSLIPLRWTYFKNNWEFIKPGLIEAISSSDNPDFLNQQISDFSSFIESQRTATHKINPFSDSQTFYRFYDIFDMTEIDAININNEEQRIIDTEIARVNGFSKNDFLGSKRNINDYHDRLADIYSLTDADYNAAVGRSAIDAQLTATLVEMNYLLTLKQSVKTIDFILANLFAVDAAVDPFALARANANNPDIDIGQYKSGTLVKLSYGESLQTLAGRYLGDPDKWIDIAIANGLKPPYIDEVGEKIQLLSNGNGNQINIAGTDSGGFLNLDKLYINQPIFLKSNAEVAPDQRTIVNIRQVPVSGEIVIELDGDSDLSKYEIADNAHIRVYQPNTINSSFYVLIPSKEPLADDRVDEVPWFLSKAASDEKKAKVDLEIDANGEINFSTNGDLKLSYGLENAIQAIKLKIITELGSLRRHPTFGLVNVLGQRNADVEAIKDMITQSLVSQIEADSRFDRIESLAVDYLVNNSTSEGVGAIAINLAVRLAGGDKVVPISFTINTK